MDTGKLILAGDIGGTKTVLALFSTSKDQKTPPLVSTRFASGQYNSLEDIIAEFLEQTGAHPSIASFGVAGPIENHQAHITNLPWTIRADSISKTFQIPQVFLLNDLQAVATIVPFLDKADLGSLNPGNPANKGTIAVIAPGTGLGVSFLVWNSSGYRAYATEGGHNSFAPRTPLQTELLIFLQGRYEHVSFERICSGKFLPNIYDFLVQKGTYAVPSWFHQELEQAPDRTPLIVQAATDKKAAICVATLDLFVQCLGTLIGNMALTLLPTGGIYLGGGIPPRIFNRLQQQDFLTAITDKGRFSTLVSTIPLHVILDSQAGLSGAARHGLLAMHDSSNYS